MECDIEIAKMELELKDVLTLVEMPENSDVEGDKVDDLEFAGPRQALLNVEAVPWRETAYSSLYLCPGYHLRVERNVKMIKEELKTYMFFSEQSQAKNPLLKDTLSWPLLTKKGRHQPNANR